MAYLQGTNEPHTSFPNLLKADRYIIGIGRINDVDHVHLERCSYVVVSKINSSTPIAFQCDLLSTKPHMDIDISTGLIYLTDINGIGQDSEKL